jgi:hypothetical protein
MKSANQFTNQFIFALMAVFWITALSGCSKPDSDDKSGNAPTSTGAAKKAGVTMDEATQERVGLKIENPAPTQWQPEIRGFGSVVDPAALVAALDDLASACSAAKLSDQELERQKTLAAQNDASARSLETAQAAATHDELAYASALAKFKTDWGSLWTQTNGLMLAKKIAAGDGALVRLELPAGQKLSASPNSARLVLSTDETNTVTAEFWDVVPGVDPKTQGQAFFFLVKGRTLPANAAVTGFLEVSGEPENGVMIPAAAILRYEGQNWVFRQSETNQFVRVSIPSGRPVVGGWFVSGDLSATNRIVVEGAQTMLSAELSDSFGANDRD